MARTDTVISTDQTTIIGHLQNGRFRRPFLPFTLDLNRLHVGSIAGCSQMQRRFGRIPGLASPTSTVDLATAGDLRCL